MENTKRAFIKAGITGVGAMAICSTANAQHKHPEVGRPFYPTNEPKRVRKSFYDLDDEELRNLCRAIGYMRNNLPLEHPLQWDNYARVHALHCTEANADHPPVHWSWNFLPWHRGYLYFLERILANILTTQFKIDGSKFALPYWDWSTHKEMPNTKLRKQAGLASPFFGYDLLQENMVNPDNLGFDNSALCEGNRGPSIHKPRMSVASELTQDSKDHVAETLHYMSKEYVSFMLAAPFEQFGGKPTVDRQTGQGLLEQGPHNDGHDWIGTRIGKNRTMGTLRNAAADPMFYMHHGNIDRIWSMYTQPQPDPKGDWGKQRYNFFDVDGSLVSMSVQEIIERTTNVSYAGPVIKAAKRPLQAAPKKTVSVMKELNDTPITIDAPEGLFGHEVMLLDVQTGPIAYTGKYTIKVFADNVCVGKIKMLDGEYRGIYKDSNVTHTFSLMLTRVPAGPTTLTFVPPKRGAFKLLIKSLEYKAL